MRWLLVLFLLVGCGSEIENRDPTGETFPTVRGESLAGDAWTLPDDLAGSPAILLIGYKQNAQFDIDRWLIGLDMRGTDARILEIPTIEGLVPGLIANQIDGGMRSGIPEDLWEAVVTIYDDAPAIREFTGTENPNNARVLGLDGAGTVVYFHDAGFSVPALRGLETALEDCCGGSRAGLPRSEVHFTRASWRTAVTPSTVSRAR